MSGDPCSHQATRSCWTDPAIHSANRKLPLQIRGKPLLLRRTIQFGLKTSRRRRTSGARSFAGTGYYETVTKLVEGETLGRFEQLPTTSSLFTTNGRKIARRSSLYIERTALICVGKRAECAFDQSRHLFRAGQRRHMTTGDPRKRERPS